MIKSIINLQLLKWVRNNLILMGVTILRSELKKYRSNVNKLKPICQKVNTTKKETIKAEEILRDLLISKNRNPSLWMQLSEVQRAGKNIVGYHLSRGEYFTLIGDFDNALNQFQFALSLSGNSFQTSETIMTKIKFVQSRLAKKRGI